MMTNSVPKDWRSAEKWTPFRRARSAAVRFFIFTEIAQPKVQMYSRPLPYAVGRLDWSFVAVMVTARHKLPTRPHIRRRDHITAPDSVTSCGSVCARTGSLIANKIHKAGCIVTPKHAKLADFTCTRVDLIHVWML